jgi:phosphopantetheinyl transferase (holo-ACP synthase)
LSILNKKTFPIPVQRSERKQLLRKMGVDVARDCQGLTVHAVSFVHGRGPVFFASMPCANETLKGRGPNRAGDKHRLVSTLWDHLLAMEDPLWKRSQSSDNAAVPVQVIHGPLGRPHLLLGEYRGPAISFSDGGGKIWAALCGDESDIGIDAAGTDEFQSEYPFHRVFHPRELQHAIRLAGGDLEKASALLWSIKEAVVKALGCAFHLVDPRQITVYPSVGGDGGYTFPVGLSGKAQARFLIGADRALWVRSFPKEKMWLSIALLNGQHR